MHRVRTVSFGLRRSGVALTVLLIAIATSSACVSEGLAFRTDTRLEITSPEDRSEVTLPLTVSWTVRDFQIVKPDEDAVAAEDAGYFAVFVDRAPQPPGESVTWVARDDPGCRPEDGCPDEEYLAVRGIYETTKTSITLNQLPQPVADATTRERHTVTVVLLDPAGRRIGESAFAVDFTVDREGA